MRSSVEFLLGLLERRDPAFISAEDWDGEHGPTLLLWQNMGFIEKDPGMNPVPSCPYCDEGVPYRCGDRLLCNRCRSTVDPRHLLLWRLNLPAFLRWIADQWKLQGGVRQIDATLWQLGTLQAADAVHECFYCRSGPLSETAGNRIAVYRRVIVLYGVHAPQRVDAAHQPHLCLLELLQHGQTLSLADPLPLLRPRGDVRFDAASGALWAGEAWLGEVPFGSKECFFLDCLARDLDRFVPYQDIKEYVLQASGSTATTEEATFCHGLKRRIKKKWIAEIDRLLTTTNKADGYRLRGYVELE